MSWFLAFAGFAALIVLHEFGHFIAAKATGMRVERFFLFFPPKLWSFRRGETEYGVGWIPLGGFVKITGMNPDEVEPRGDRDEDDSSTPNDLLTKIESAGQENEDHLPDGTLRPEIRRRAYYAQPVWKRIVVIAAGPAMNFLIAFVILFALAFNAEEVNGPGLEVAQVAKDAPAEGQLQEGDLILAVDGVTASDREGADRADELRERTAAHGCPGEPTDGCVAETPVTFLLERNGEQVAVKIKPEYDEGEERMLVGFVFGVPDSALAPVDPGPAEAAGISLDQMWFVTSRTVEVFADIIDPETRKELSGVVGSYETTRQAVEVDTQRALLILAVISLSLAIINLFPFLPLDGGHIFWSLVEKVRGKRPSMRAMERGAAVGFVLVLFLFAIGLNNDLNRIFSGEGFEVR
jgi:regulator of sigma E protease